MTDEQYNELSNAVTKLAQDMGICSVADLTSEEIRSIVLEGFANKEGVLLRLQKRRDDEEAGKAGRKKGASTSVKKRAR